MRWDLLCLHGILRRVRGGEASHSCPELSQNKYTDNRKTCEVFASIHLQQPCVNSYIINITLQAHTIYQNDA